MKEAELTALLKLTPLDIWNSDLDNFMGEWHVSPDLPLNIRSVS